jgi:hypothetical protein
MSTALGDFQRSFVAALYGEQTFWPARQRAFGVYRNTVLKGCIDALEANFPAVVRLVGGEWFRAAAATYARRHPPVARSLLFYGDGFADWLAGFEPARELPYLPGVASLDLMWLLAHSAADESALAAADLAGLSPQSVGALHLRPHPTARWMWFPEVPVYSIWDANRSSREAGPELEWRGEGALLVRRAEVVSWMGLDLAGCRFMDACRAGRSLTEAITERMPEAPADAGDPADWFLSLLGAGAFARQIVR